jgi:hypothetical protein
MSTPDVRATVRAALNTVQGTKHHLGLVTLDVLTDHVTEAVEQIVDAYRAENLAEGAALVEDKACDADFTEDPQYIAGLRTAAELLTRAAGEKATAAATAATPDFFQVGHTYTEPDGSTDWKFRCDAITTHPEDGERTALGWRHFRGEWSECAYGEDDWEIHQIADRLIVDGGETR